jgi:hypothetical protein
MSQGRKRPSLRGALSKPAALLAPTHRSRDEWESLPHTDGAPVTQGRVTGFCRLIVLAVLGPLAPDAQGLMGAALPSDPI